MVDDRDVAGDEALHETLRAAAQPGRTADDPRAVAPVARSGLLRLATAMGPECTGAIAA